MTARRETCISAETPNENAGQQAGVFVFAAVRYQRMANWRGVKSITSVGAATGPAKRVETSVP